MAGYEIDGAAVVTNFIVVMISMIIAFIISHLYSAIGTEELRKEANRLSEQSRDILQEAERLKVLSQDLCKATTELRAYNRGLLLLLSNHTGDEMSFKRNGEGELVDVGRKFAVGVSGDVAATLRSRVPTETYKTSQSPAISMQRPDPTP